MEVKPSKGLKVKVTARKEAVFGEDGITIAGVSFNGGAKVGVMTGMTLAGFAEIEMPALDGKKHWYPVEEIAGEKGEKIVEEEIQIDAQEDGAEEE